MIGESYHHKDISKILEMESFVVSATQRLRLLLNTLDGFGQPKTKEF